MKDNLDNELEININEIYLRLLSEIESEKRLSKEKEHSVHERLRKHQLWLDSNGQDGIRFQARNENFTGIDFSHKDLRKSEFYSCTMDYCNFYGANFGGLTTLCKCSIKKSLVIQVNLENTRFFECNIENSNFRSSKFVRVHMTGTLLEGSDLTSTNNDFSGCIFKDSVFKDFSFLGSKIDGATLDGVQFKGCDLSFLDFTNTNINSSLVMNQCKSIYIKLSGMLIEGSSLVDCNLTNAKLDGAIAKGSDFSRSDLTRASFRNADLAKSRFNMTQGNDMKFYGADMNNSEMRLSSFREANFYNCKLDEADLSGSDLLDALINDTTNRNLTNFSGCTWTNGKRCKAGSIGTCNEEV